MCIDHFRGTSRRRLAVLALSAFLGGACMRAPPPAGPTPIPAPAAASTTAATTLFLIGDSGGPATNPVLRALRRELERDPARSMVLFLGDNLYPTGLPAPAERGFREAERRLQAQIDAVRQTGARAVFVPGNHDWGRPGDGAALRRQGEFIAIAGAPAVSLLPPGGCPGPAVLDVDLRLRVILLDTEWWLRTPDERARAAPQPCLATEAEVLTGLRSALASAGGRRVVVAAHHPLASVGLHGGRMGWRDQIFPLRDAWTPLWIPLPVLGTAYQLTRAAVAAEQDLDSERYEHLRRSIRNVLAAQPPLIYVAGHDHNLQVLRGRGAAYLLVSGGGTYGNASPVGPGGKAVFARAISGFMRLELPDTGVPRLDVIQVDGSGTGRSVYTIALDERRAVAETLVVTPNAAYHAGWLHRLLLGANYRDLWGTPIAVEMLDLRAEAGGLRPTQRGGSQQTRSLRFIGADGREYVFRSLDKDPSPGLPPDLRETLVLDLVRDQTSAYHPGAALVVARLLDATGIHHAQPRLVVLPRDSLLGEFATEFGGLLGTFEERPGEGFTDGRGSAPASDVIGSDKLFERMQKNPDVQVDARAFLAARLFDNFVGDRDRHRDQWRWARFGPESAPWEPIPRDRDMAFVKQQGLLLSLTRQWYPQLTGFGGRYAPPLGLNWNGREIDRRLLAGLERAVWDSVVRELQAAIADSVIDAAVAVLPPPFAASNADELRAALHQRREELPALADRYYEMLASEVDVHGTDRRDLAEVTWRADGSVEVTLGARSGHGPRGPPAFRRRFLPSETREVRLYLHGADDRAVLRGTGAAGVPVRIVGGTGDDEVVDSTAAGAPVQLYDDAGRNRIEGTTLGLDQRAYVPPPSRRPMDPPRDWGHDWRPAPWVNAGPDIGLFLGVGRTLYRYGFREHPHASRQTLQVGYAFGAGKVRAQYEGDFHRMNGRGFATVLARASGIEIIRFYGLGNGTTAGERSEFYRVHQTQLQLEPAVALPVAERAMVTLGAVAKYVRTDERAGTLVGETRPYGSGSFGQLGLRGGMAWDTRDHPVIARRGARLQAGGALFPAALDVARTYGESYATAAAFLSPGSQRAPTLALRAGGRHIWGDFPFFEAAFLGGRSTLRGWDEERFAGRTSMFGNAELRVPLGRIKLIVPTEIGIFGLADAGRVAPSAGAGDWHTGIGGGMWIAPFKRTNALSVAVARGKERSAAYARMGMLF